MLIIALTLVVTSIAYALAHAQIGENMYIIVLIYAFSALFSIGGRVAVSIAFWHFSSTMNENIKMLIGIGVVLTPLILIPILDTIGIILLGCGLYMRTKVE